jgi:hypothetical protein
LSFSSSSFFATAAASFVPSSSATCSFSAASFPLSLFEPEPCLQPDEPLPTLPPCRLCSIPRRQFGCVWMVPTGGWRASSAIPMRCQMPPIAAA